MKVSVKLDDEVRKKLSCEILEIYNKAVEATEIVHYEELCEIYEEGFSFGLLIGVQACEIAK